MKLREHDLNEMRIGERVKRRLRKLDALQGMQAKSQHEPSRAQADGGLNVLFTWS